MAQRLKVVVVIPAVMILLAAACVFGATHARFRAKGFLEHYRKLVVGSTTYAEAKSDLASYGQSLSDTEACSSIECRLDFGFRNSWLSFLHLAPPTELSASLFFEGGVLHSRETIFGQGICCVALVREVPNSTFGEPLSRGLSVRLERDDNGLVRRATLNLALNASTKERAEAYAFNLACLSRLGGCKSAAELLPTGSGGWVDRP